MEPVAEEQLAEVKVAGEALVKLEVKPAMPVFVLTNEQELTVSYAVEHWKVEDLREEFRSAYEKMRTTGPGVCSKRRFSYGCTRCDERKAWNYYVRQELGLLGSKAKPKKK